MSDIGNGIVTLLVIEVTVFLFAGIILTGLILWGLWAIFGPIGVCL
jgi:hypothetical protein